MNTRIRKGINLFKRFISRSSQPNEQTSLVQNTQSQNISVSRSLGSNVDYFEEHTKHRPILHLFDLEPKFFNCWIAPNATIVGEVLIQPYCSIWYNAVIRGDINTVKIGRMTSIGEYTVIHTANSLPTGLPAVCQIGDNNIIQSRVSLYSCITEKDVFIGTGSVVMEGSRIEQGAILLPGSVVPPGRIIPARQVWGGNPVRFVREAKESEQFANYILSYEHWDYGQIYLDSYTPHNYAYLEKESTREDVDLLPEDLEARAFNRIHNRTTYKTYLV